MVRMSELDEARRVLAVLIDTHEEMHAVANRMLMLVNEARERVRLAEAPVLEARDGHLHLVEGVL